MATRVTDVPVTASPTDFVVKDTFKQAAWQVRVDLSSSSTPSQAYDAVDSVCTALQRQEASAEYLRLLLGRVLVVIQDNRLYEPANASFEQYSRSVEAKYHVSRATIQNAILVARRLPNLSAHEAESIPMTSLTLAARAAKDATPAQIHTILHDASKMQVEDFRESLERHGLIGVSRPEAVEGSVDTKDKVKVVLWISKDVAALWEKAVGEREASEVFESAIRMLTMHSGAAKSASASRSTAHRKVA
jgi:hypothetical protein